MLMLLGSFGPQYYQRPYTLVQGLWYYNYYIADSGVILLVGVAVVAWGVDRVTLMVSTVHGLYREFCLEVLSVGLLALYKVLLLPGFTYGRPTVWTISLFCCHVHL